MEALSTRGKRGRVADGTLRLGPLRDLPRVLDELAADTDGLLAECGLVRADFDDPETIISFRTGDALLVQCERATGCTHLGLLIGKHLTQSCMGPLGFLMQSSRTVGEALLLLQRYLHVHDRGAVITFEKSVERVALGYRAIVPGLSSLVQIHTIAMLVACNFLRSMLGSSWKPIEVTLPFEAPIERQAFKTAFNAPVRFNAEAGAIVLSAADFDRRLPTTDPVLWRMMSERVKELESMMERGLVDQVRQVLRTPMLPPKRTPSVVARRLGMSVRTLNRRLAAYGTSVRALRDEVVRASASELLTTTAKPVAEIAGLLSYSDATAFSRACRRWFGVGPAQWRAQGPPPTRSHAVADSGSPAPRA